MTISTTMSTSPVDTLILLGAVDRETLPWSLSMTGINNHGMEFIVQSEVMHQHDLRITLLPDGTWKPHFNLVIET